MRANTPRQSAFSPATRKAWRQDRLTGRHQGRGNDDQLDWRRLEHRGWDTQGRTIVDLLDASDEGKWDITNRTTSGDQSAWFTQVVIDRNTGDFNYYRSKEGGISTTASGTCEKVKLSARKF